MKRPRAQGSMSRRRVLVWGLAGAGAISIGGIGAGGFIKSPQQAAADAAPPAPATLTAEVERRVLVDTVVLRGTVAAGGTFEVTPTSREGREAVVTRVQVTVGSTVKAASTLLEVGGRPLFALPGSIPVYRDLRPGMSGKDVKQLQSALRSVGVDPGESNGVFGPGTKRAVTKLYQRLSYEPMVEGDPQTLVASAEQVRQAKRALVAAQEQLGRLLSAQPAPANDAADVVQARRTVTYAEEDLATAKKADAEVQARSGPMLPAAEVVFLPKFPARVDALKARVGSAVVAPLITMSSGALVVRAKINPAQRALLREGMPVEITAELLGVTGDGRIESIGDLEADETGTRAHELVVVSAGDPLDPRLAAQDVRLTVRAASTDGEVLVVPLSGVFSGADGKLSVQLLEQGGRLSRVTVTTGVSGDGYVAVTPVDGSIDPGDRVVVGVTGR
ncbi:peptidoglycan-binding protein [Catellatospora chokoriensis]|nr:peptidoglycan-binding protein [Catellatospora chokoriensis]